MDWKDKNFREGNTQHSGCVFERLPLKLLIDERSNKDGRKASLLKLKQDLLRFHGSNYTGTK